MTRSTDQASPAPTRLGDLSWTAAVEWFRRDPGLLFPIGSCVQHGPHLPLATDSIVISRLADAVGARYGVLIAPLLPLGVASRVEREYGGTTAIARKTLHSILNDVIATWEEQGVEEVTLLTANGFAPHVHAMATVVAERARVRSVDLHAIDLSRFLAHPHAAEHAGEMETSLMLYLEPGLVRKEAIRDHWYSAEQVERLRTGEEPIPPHGSEGVVGHPSLASAEKGEAIFEYLVARIGDRLFGEEARRASA